MKREDKIYFRCVCKEHLAEARQKIRPDVLTAAPDPTLERASGSEGFPLRTPLSALGCQSNIHQDVIALNDRALLAVIAVGYCTMMDGLLADSIHGL